MRSLLALSLLPVVWSQTIKNLVIFGDSYSATDAGNFQRWTNGPLWSEHLAVGWNASLHSFATSGAMCDNAPFSNLTDLETTSSVKDQVEHYYSLSLNHTVNETVFAFWVGATDIQNTFKLQGEHNGDLDVRDIATCVIKQMRDFRRVSGANRLLLLNVLPLQHLPYFSGTDMEENRGKAAADLNKLLLQEANRMNKYHHALELDIVDVYTLLSDIIADPAMFNFTDATTPFWDNCQGQCAEENMNEYVWWDQTHLTGGVHEKIANSILSAASYTASTWVKSEEVQGLIDDKNSPYRAKNYISPPNTGLISRLADEVNAAKKNAKNTSQQQSTSVEEDKDMKSSLGHSYLMFSLVGLVCLGIVVGIRKRRNSNAFSNVSSLFSSRRGPRFTPLRKVDDSVMA
ncbi:hypothetical protein EC973_001107 [Apophysomyces ossiformis]|uniref:Carbohydrate esterase family 16 protein n=1 Tax=Apophysomyces ossiformis TaxID=679940 RepID=A0A8H7BQI7_9FUNG|nr:hypothetical protein EC973_001107 [Apophysomyces ossiformis]